MTREPGRIATLLIALAAMGALLTGCGGGGDIVPLSRFRDPRQTPRQEAVAFARAVNLRASDVPFFGTISEPESRPTPEQEKLSREFTRCIGGGPNPDRRLANVVSTLYGTQSTLGLLRVQSEVEVEPSPELASSLVARYSTRRGRNCVARFLRLYFQSSLERISFGPMSVWRLPEPLPVVDGSFGYRLATRVEALPDTTQLASYHPGGGPVSTRRSTPFYIDVLQFASDRADIGLTAIGAPHPVSKVLERRLLRRFLDRAEAAQP